MTITETVSTVTEAAPRRFVDPNRHVLARDLEPQDLIYVRGHWREVLEVFTSADKLGDFFGVTEHVQAGAHAAPDARRRNRYRDGEEFGISSAIDTHQGGETFTDWAHLGDLLETGEYVAVRVFLSEHASGGDAASAWVTYPKHTPVPICTPID